MSGSVFLAWAIAAGVAGLVAAWLVAAGHESVPRRRQRALPGVADTSSVDVGVAAAYLAAVRRARCEPTERLLALHQATADRHAPTAGELLAWVAAHHVLVAERGVTPLAETRARRAVAR